MHIIRFPISDMYRGITVFFWAFYHGTTISDMYHGFLNMYIGITIIFFYVYHGIMGVIWTYAMYAMVFLTCTVVLQWYFEHLPRYYRSILNMYCTMVLQVFFVSLFVSFFLCVP